MARDSVRSTSSMPPSPVVVEVPASRAPRARAVLALRDSAPKLIPVTIRGISSSSGRLANRVPSTVRVEQASRYPSRGMRVSVPGMKVRSSNVAHFRGRSEPKPRMR